eukprot:gene16974-20151_t
MADPAVQNLTEQLAQRDAMIAMMKTKTKEYVTKLSSDHDEAVQKLKKDHEVALGALQKELQTVTTQLQ